MKKVYLTNADCHNLAISLSSRIMAFYAKIEPPRRISIFGVPKGGIPVCYLLASIKSIYLVVDDPADADFIIDDIIDSGDTYSLWSKMFPTIPFFSLVKPNDYPSWVVFPWEGDTEGSIESNITRLLQFIGEDPSRQGLQETPNRVAKAWQHWTSGYSKKPEDILKVFEDGADNCDEMVIIKNIPFYTHCEHHLAPFFGTASVTYIPDGKIVGLSKISRIVDIFSRRLQVQERLTNQIADALNDNLHPKGVGVVITARHLCMESRGICQQGHSTVTSALRGVLKENPSARAEFLELIK